MSNNYLVLVHEEYCGGQAIITHPNKEGEDDVYVGLSNSHPICIGSYRGESRTEAIREAAKSFECSEEILYAIPLSE